MIFQRTYTFTLTAITAAVLAACSSHEQPVEPIRDTTRPSARAAETPAKILSDYQTYQNALTAAKQDDDILPQQFLSQAAHSAMTEEVHNEWLKSLGRRGAWQQFKQQYAKLDQAGRSQEVQCFAELGNSQFNGLAATLVKETKRLPQGCTLLIENAASAGRLNTQDAWRRVRGLIGNNQITDARNLAAALGSPFDGGGQGAQEARLINIIGKKKSASGKNETQPIGSPLERHVTTRETSFEQKPKKMAEMDKTKAPKAFKQKKRQQEVLNAEKPTSVSQPNRKGNFVIKQKMK